MTFRIKFHPYKNRFDSDDIVSEENYIKYKNGSCSPKTCRFIGIVFFFLGLALLFLITQERFSCQRPENMCIVQERHFWESDFRTVQKMPLSDIKYAYVDSQESTNSDGDTSITYFVKIRTINGDKKLFHSSGSNRSDYEADAQRINNFINYDIPELLLTTSFLWFLFPLAFVIVGLLFIWIPYYMKKKAKKEQNLIVER